MKIHVSEIRSVHDTLQIHHAFGYHSVFVPTTGILQEDNMVYCYNTFNAVAFFNMNPEEFLRRTEYSVRDFYELFCLIKIGKAPVEEFFLLDRFYERFLDLGGLMAYYTAYQYLGFIMKELDWFGEGEPDCGRRYAAMEARNEVFEQIALLCRTEKGMSRARFLWRRYAPTGYPFQPSFDRKSEGFTHLWLQPSIRREMLMRSPFAEKMIRLKIGQGNWKE